MESKATTAARVLLGLVFFGFGFNGLFHIVPLPPGEGAAAVFINGLIASRYFFPLLFVTYLLTGVALLIGRFVPLALTALAPVIVNITVMHFFVPSSGAEICLAALVTALEIFLAWSYRAAFRQLLRA
jgi:putative oxidoreductase